MITVKEASEKILELVQVFPEETIPFSQANGRVLREKILADRDFPPFDRVMMDGICLRFEQIEQGQHKFEMKGRQLAGSPPLSLASTDGCLEIMTGASLANGTDTVVPFEDFEVEKIGGKKFVIIKKLPPKRYKNVHLKGTDKKQGAMLLDKGTALEATELAVIASVGKASIRVTRKPKVAIISTGDELVGIDQTPAAHQIRRSNVYAIQASLAEYPVDSENFHLDDNKEKLKEEIGQIIEKFDVLILSGGVSKGKADFVPEVLEGLGVEKLFHRVAQRPGKPFWFGKSPKGKSIFAFPGNPVSIFMCHYKYFIPWLRKSLGLSEKPRLNAILDQDFDFKPDLTFFLQVKVQSGEFGQLKAIPFVGKGSGDFANLLLADAFLELPQGRNAFKKGDVFQLIPFRNL